MINHISCVPTVCPAALYFTDIKPSVRKAVRKVVVYPCLMDEEMDTQRAHLPRLQAPESSQGWGLNSGRLDPEG